MKIEELRVGNYVNYFSDNAYRWIDNRQLSANDLSCLLADAGDDAKPIPLTSFGLLNFGFLWNGESGWFELSGWMPYVVIPFDSSISGTRRYRLTTFKKDWNLSEFEHVHQLQNLYFALTGKELLIKEKD